ncbi:MAG: metal-dependent hydrolase [Pirellulaceae bacterium]
MDILTHALIGSATAAGFLPAYPGFACGVALGNVLPDLDSLSRLGGKRAFLRFHQTVSHSLAAIASVAVLAFPFFAAGLPIHGQAFLGLAVGMAMHVATDLTNSYGVRLLWPFHGRRLACDWIFFIDAPILALSILSLGVAYLVGERLKLWPWISTCYLGLFAAYVWVRWRIAREARKACHQRFPNAERVVAIPTTWSVFKFLVCADFGDRCITCQLNVRSGRISNEQEFPIFDGVLPDSVLALSEWRTMRDLSPYYHAVEFIHDDNAAILVCRDLRFRNFGVHYGRLTCRVSVGNDVTFTNWEI